MTLVPKNILVTNDDGWDSPGLWTLVRALAPFAQNLYVVAPTENQSGVGTGLTLRRELHWTPIESPSVPVAGAWHINGTPGDCVTIGLRRLVKHWIDLVVSGVNQGANVGNDILASGTVGAALQGHFRGVSSVAISQVTESFEPRDVDWSVAEQVCSMLGRVVTTESVFDSVFLNVNIPNVGWEQIRGVLVTRMGRHGYMRLEEVASDSVVLEREEKPHMNPDSPPGTDFWALANGYVSVSPLQSNLTDHRLIDVLGDRVGAIFRA
jgi:5'-nucleotidase